jgi:hypothetical protein
MQLKAVNEIERKKDRKKEGRERMEIFRYEFSIALYKTCPTLKATRSINGKDFITTVTMLIVLAPYKWIII